MSSDGRIKENTKSRLAQAKKVFLRKRNLLTLNINLYIGRSF